MSKPYIHAKSSARRYGGVPEDYLDIHNMMDSSKSAVGTNMHRIVFHSAFGCFIIEHIFGVKRTNSEGKEYSVRDIAEQHILEDFGMRFVPSLQDYLQDIPIPDWVNNGNGWPPSFKATIEEKKKTAMAVQPPVMQTLLEFLEKEIKENTWPEGVCDGQMVQMEYLAKKETLEKIRDMLFKEEAISTPAPIINTRPAMLEKRL